MCIWREMWEKALQSLAFSSVSKPHTHITCMLRQCTSIVYILRHYKQILCHLWDWYYVTINQFMMATIKLPKWRLQFTWSCHDPLCWILYPENPGTEFTCRLWNIILNEIYKLDTSAAGIFLDINGKFRIE